MYGGSKSSLAEGAIKAIQKSRTLEIKLSSDEELEPSSEAETGPTKTEEMPRQDLAQRHCSNKKGVIQNQQKLEPQLSSKWSTLSGGLQSPKTEVPKDAILQRINSKKAMGSYQLGHQLSRKWSTGAGPRIGCVNDYPQEVRLQALEMVNLSPGQPSTPSANFIPIVALVMLSPTFQLCTL